MENFYFLFESIDNWEVWDEKGYNIGFLILIITSILINSIYYVFLGRKTDAFASLGKWFLFLLFNSLLIFVITLVAQGFGIFEHYSFQDFQYEIWNFSIINTVYSIFCFFLFSVGFKYFSIHNKYYPF